MNEKEKMISGKLYDPADKELAALRNNAHMLSQMYNNTFENEAKKRNEILEELIPQQGKNVYIQGPIYFDYGQFTKIGDNFYANYNLTILDCCPVAIGDNVMIGPNCSILTPSHPLCYQERNTRFKSDGTPFNYEYAKPVAIGNNCWIAGNVTIIGGVEIGDGCVIGAGSIVTKNIAPNSLAVGNPCRVIREITENDRMIDHSVTGLDS